MHILYFHQHFSTLEGSAGTRSYEMARQLLSEGHTVTMVCGSYAQGKTGLTGKFRSGKRRGDVDGIDVVEFDLAYSNAQGFVGRSLVFLRFALSSMRLAMTEPCDLVFATTTPLTSGIPGILARWLRRKPFVFEVRDLWPELPRAMKVIRSRTVLGLMSALEWASYHSATRCIALSPGIAEGIGSRGIPADRIAMVPNGCDLAVFRNGVTPRRPDEVDQNHFLAVFSGTHGLANGLDAVLDAARVLKERRRRDIRIALVGEGREKARLVAEAQEYALDNIIFLPPLPKRQLASLLAGADLGLQVLKNVPAFYYGTSPNKFFDYISARLPVLINYPGWLTEMILEHDCGLATRPDDATAFADALEAAADDRAGLRLKAENAGRLAEEEFDRRKLARQWSAWVTCGHRR